MSKRRRPRKLRKKRAAQQAAAAKRQTPNSVRPANDVHHLCWQRRKWKKSSANYLRNHWYFKVSIGKNTLHHEIHFRMQSIPVPDGDVAKRAVHTFMEIEAAGGISRDDSIEQRLELLIYLFAGTPTGEAFKKQLSIVKNYAPR